MRQRNAPRAITLAALLLSLPALSGPSDAQTERYRYRFGGQNHGLHFVSSTQGIVTRDGGGVLVSADSGQTWSEAEVPTEVRKQLRHVFVLDEENIWTVGSGGVVLKSTTRGDDWTLLNQSAPVLDRDGQPAVLYDIWMHSALDGIVCGENGALAKTSSGGASWSAVPLPIEFYDPTDSDPIFSTPGDIYRFHFFDGQDGIVTADHGRWMTTSDAGATWQSGVPTFTHYCGSDPLGDLELWGMDFDGDEGWIVGGNGTNNAHTFYTDDRGLKWEHIDYIVPLDSIAQGALTSGTGGWATFYGVQALGNGEAIAVSYASGVLEFSGAGSLSALAVDRCNPTGPLVSTTEPTWFQTGMPAFTGSGVGPGRPPFTTVFALSAQQRWLVGRFGTILEWDHSTANWIPRGTPQVVQHRFTHADFLDSQVGLITAQGHRILKTSNGGQSFTEVHIGSDAGDFMERVALSRKPNSGLALAAGSSGFMTRSTDQGDTWSGVQPPHIQAIDLRFAGATDTVYASGPAGYVFRADASVVTDGIFLDWTNVSVPDDNFAVNGVAFVDADTGYAVTSGMKAWFTSNGGATWSDVALLSGPSSTQPLHAVATFGDASKAVAVGAAGTVLVRDSGRFQGVDLSSLIGDTPLNAVQVIAGGTKIVVGGNDGIVVEFEGTSFADALDPQNWIAPKSMTNERIVAVSFDAVDHGFLVGQQGLLVEFD